MMTGHGSATLELLRQGVDALDSGDQFLLPASWRNDGYQVSVDLLGREPSASERSLIVASPPIEVLRTLLSRSEVARRVLAACSRGTNVRKRMHFLHVPRTGGTSLLHMMMTASNTVVMHHETLDLLAEHAEYASQIRQWVDMALSGTPYIFVQVGHLSVPRLLSEGYFESGDRVFSIGRDPRRQVLSVANYIATKLGSNLESDVVHRRYFEGLLCLEGLLDHDSMGESELQSLPARLLRSDMFRDNYSNAHCLAWGLESPTASSALTGLELVDGKIVSLPSAVSLAQSEGVEFEESPSVPNLNASREFIAWPDLSGTDRRFIEQKLVFQDLALVEDVQFPNTNDRHRNAWGRSSVKGKFMCTLCLRTVPYPWEPLHREMQSCEACGSTVRERSLVLSVCEALAGSDLTTVTLREFLSENEGGLRAIGVSDSVRVVKFMSKHFVYRDTSLVRGPVLDVSNPGSAFRGAGDVVTCSDVLEHVMPPVEGALSGLRTVLAPGGLLVLTVPLQEAETIEHYPGMRGYTMREGVCIATWEDGTESAISDPVWHGGVGNTLEMRTMGRGDLEISLFDSGFAEVAFHNSSRPEFGIRTSPWGLAISARRK